MGKHFIRLTVLVKFYEISTTFVMPADTVLVRLFYFILFFVRLLIKFIAATRMVARTRNLCPPHTDPPN